MRRLIPELTRFAASRRGCLPAPRLAAAGLFAVILLGRSAVGADYRPPRKDLGFPVYTNAPAGRQLAGQHAPASTPALSPEEARRKFTLPDGFEIRLFASEPEVVNPVAMTWDERGRLWVVELYEYPLGAKPGEKPRDRIKILEDTDADGAADKVHVWADGLNLATGILLGRGGAFVGQAPHLLFLRDTDGDDRADRTEIVKTGFGLEDRHELLNGFTWGPDGQMYMTHGVFTRSKVVGPDGAGGEPVLLTAGVARLNTQTKQFEVYAEGTSNPWGVDFDRAGNAFVSACVIEHLFHLVPGGLYDRQAGSPPFPYAYESLPAINDHKHYMAAYAGIQVYQGDQFPADNLGTILQGNIHDNAVHQDRLTPNGSSFVASPWRDLVRANDGWFMPVSVQGGPDGAVWIMDWYDRYPCYQNANADPAGVDREHGRIWRVVYTGAEKGKPVPSRPRRDLDLARLPSAELVEYLAHPDAWQRRMAQRVLSDRRDDTVQGRLQRMLATGKPAAAPGGTTASAAPIDARLAAFWTLFSSGYLADDVLFRAATDGEPLVRLWAARFLGERRIGGEREVELLTRLGGDEDPSVRLAVAVACRQFTSEQLTVDRPPQRQETDISGILGALIGRSADARDPVIPFMIWQAAEPLIAAIPGPGLDWLAANGAAHLPLTETLTRKAIRRVGEAGTPEAVDRAVDFVARTLPSSPELARGALDGLIQAQQGRVVAPSKPFAAFIDGLLRHGDARLVERGQTLGALWGDPAGTRGLLARAGDASAPISQRIRAIQSARRVKTDATREVLFGLLTAEAPAALQTEALAALAEVGGDPVPAEVIRRWTGLSPEARRAAASTLASRPSWALPLLAEVKAGRISATEFGAPVIRNLLNHRDDAVRNEAKAAIGKFRESGQDKARLVAAKRAMVVSGQPDLAAGHAVAEKTCLVCHQLHGEGQNVGPDLTGVGRSSLDALLWNVIDPNQVIGAGYEQVEVETRDDRVVAGRLMESTDARVRLLLQGGKEEIIGRADVKSQRTLEGSVMPEGLEQMPDADFRNLIWYILAPPQEGPLTNEKREKLGAGGGSAAGASGSASTSPARVDHESVALWNPEWEVRAPDFEGTPLRLPEYHGRANVLETHPFDATSPAAIQRSISLPANRAARLRFAVASHDQGDWELRVVVDGKELLRRTVGAGEPRWSPVSVDLSPFAGRTVVTRLENAANDWAWEFGYWADVKVEVSQGTEGQ